MLTTRLIGGLTAALFSGFVSVYAAEIKVDLGPANFGMLDQDNTTACKDATGAQIDGSQACGPTAAVNSFQFLENRYPDIYGGKLIPRNTSNLETDWISTANTLGTAAYMDCACNGGTDITKFIQGKQDYIDEKAGDGKSVFKHQDVFMLGDIDKSKSRGRPSFDFLLMELMHGEDVELLVSYHDTFDFADDNNPIGPPGNHNNDRIADADTMADSYGGHFLTMTGLTLNDANNNGTFDMGEALKLFFIDPGTGMAGSADAFLNSFGFDTNYGFGGPITGASISAIVSESPIPEPETVALFIVCLVGFAGFKARRTV